MQVLLGNLSPLFPYIQLGPSLSSVKPLEKALGPPGDPKSSQLDNENQPGVIDLLKTFFSHKAGWKC